MSEHAVNPPAGERRVSLEERRRVDECNRDITPVESKGRFRHLALIIVVVHQSLQSTQRRLPWSLPAVAVAVASLAFILWFIGGRSVVGKFVRNRTQPWAVFRVPETAPPLTGLDAKLSGDVVTICNHGNDEWSKVLVQIDAGYLAAIDLLQVGDCKQLKVFEDFTTESWKRMPPPRDLYVTRVAVLANVDQKRYAQKSLLH